MPNLSRDGTKSDWKTRPKGCAKNLVVQLQTAFAIARIKQSEWGVAVIAAHEIEARTNEGGPYIASLLQLGVEKHRHGESWINVYRHKRTHNCSIP